jgi:hypothetical protein
MAIGQIIAYISKTNKAIKIRKLRYKFFTIMVVNCQIIRKRFEVTSCKKIALNG